MEERGVSGSEDVKEQVIPVRVGYRYLDVERNSLPSVYVWKVSGEYLLNLAFVLVDFA